MKYIVAAYLVVVAVMSLVAFVTYGWDKRCARTNAWRVPEKTLHLLALLGGWPGALAGQRAFRHKTQKLGFQIIFWLIVVLHIAILSGIMYFWFR